MSLNVSLPPELESRVRAHVASGMFGSASEVIREALRLFEAYHLSSTLPARKWLISLETGVQSQTTKRVW